MPDNNNILAEALYNVLSREMLDEMEKCGHHPGHSDKFEKKMRKLIKKQKKPYFRLTNTAGKRVVCVLIIAVMMFTASMSVEAWRRTFIGFITKPFATHTDVETVRDDRAPTLIEREYLPGYIPDGFELTDSSLVREFSSIHIYENSGNSDEMFMFEQWVKPQYMPSVNTEGYEMEPIEINGCEGFIIDSGDMDGSGGLGGLGGLGWCLVSWNSGDYIFQIAGSIDRDTVLKIAGSV